MTAVLIVDDHASMRETLWDTLQRLGDFQLAGSIGNANLAKLFCERMHPDLVLMDVCTEDGASGLAATEAIKADMPEIRVIIMTSFDEISYAPRAKAAGADAFVYKSNSLSFFVEVIQTVLAGGHYYPEPRRIPVQQGEAPLTEREMEILRLLCRHMTNAEIAAELFISENTVKYHKGNMLAKTGFQKSVDLAFYMISHGWINPLF